jgi:hypothetical protein
MSPAQIQKQFASLLTKGRDGVANRRRIQMSSSKACWYRYQLKHQGVGLPTMIRWLKAAGIDPGTQQSYSAADMISFARFCAGKRQATGKALGYPYLLEKFDIQKN